MATKLYEDFKERNAEFYRGHMKQVIIKDTISDSLAAIESLYARSFLWLLYSDNHNEVHRWMKRIKTDLVNNTIYFEVYEDTAGQVHDFLQALSQSDNKERLCLDHMDRNGKISFTLFFTELELLKHTLKYDMASSDVLTNRVMVQFKKIERW